MSRLSVHVWLSSSFCRAHLARRRCCVSHCTSGCRHLSVHILLWHLGVHLRAHLAVPMSGRPPPFVSVSVRLCPCLSLICSSASVSASVIRLACFLAVLAISMASHEAPESASWPSSAHVRLIDIFCTSGSSPSLCAHLARRHLSGHIWLVAISQCTSSCCHLLVHICLPLSLSPPVSVLVSSLWASVASIRPVFYPLRLPRLCLSSCLSVLSSTLFACLGSVCLDPVYLDLSVCIMSDWTLSVQLGLELISWS